MRRRIPVPVPEGMKYCHHCKALHPRADFSPGPYKDGLRVYCRLAERTLVADRKARQKAAAAQQAAA
jgi:hypothetical protein